MGTPYHLSYACLDCRKSFKRLVNPLDEVPEKLPCPDCGKPKINLGRHFKPPKKSDTKQWAKVKFLVEHGFRFQKIQVDSGHHDTVPYPESLEEAKEFVVKYKEFATPTLHNE
jgi:DNA-directed RNA polymerase subunit RPC12/RpoP